MLLVVVLGMPTMDEEADQAVQAQVDMDLLSVVKDQVDLEMPVVFLHQKVIMVAWVVTLTIKLEVAEVVPLRLEVLDLDLTQVSREEMAQ